MINNVTHITVFVENQDRALAYYTEELGFKLHTDVQHGPMRWLTVQPAHNKKLEIVLMLAESPEEKALVGKQGPFDSEGLNKKGTCISTSIFCVETDTCFADIHLLVENQDEALAFYTEKLGFKVRRDFQRFGFRFLCIQAAHDKDIEIDLLLAESPEDKALVGKQAAQKPLFSVSTDDCKSTVKELKDKGVTFISEIKEERWGTSVSFIDLYGNIIYMVQPAKY